MNVPTIVVNGEDRKLLAPTTVDALIAAIGCGRRGVAVAVNRKVVPKSQWATHELSPGDRVEVLNASQGG